MRYSSSTTEAKNIQESGVSPTQTAKIFIQTVKSVALLYTVGLVLSFAGMVTFFSSQLTKAMTKGNEN